MRSHVLYIVFALHEAADVDALHVDFFCEF